MEILNNSWVVGIGGGVISGLLVFLITRFLFSKKDNREYLMRLNSANTEILHSIRPLIVEEQYPTDEIIESIINSTAKKHSVRYFDLYDVDLIADDLTKEILDNSFLTSERKMKYCELVKEMKSQFYEDEDSTEEHNAEPLKLLLGNREKSISSQYLSLTLALFSGITTVVWAVVGGTDQSNILENLSILEIVLLISFIPVVSLGILRGLERLKKESTTEQKNQRSAKEERTEPNRR
ncbi:hypothetical protein [Marinoscillum sp.]|uniref:hypothetical protein n=1 Tax=Marinoscillum sp. TaxID=2024838 RepID=UPI003BA95AE2